MANVYKTAKGKVIDIDKLKLSNEATVAVGNMKVNARGDLLGTGGQVVATRNQVMDQVYNVQDSGYSPNDPAVHAHQQTLVEASTKQLTDLVDNSIVTTAPTTNASVAPAARGSLADSIAKQTTVTQEPIPTPQEQKKSNGPSRI